MSRFATLLLGSLVLFICVSRVGAEEKPEGLAGKWVSQNQEKHPLVFEANGTFKYGYEMKNGEWVLVTGKYTIDAKGKITGEIHHKGVIFRPWYLLKDGVLQGPRGPNPRVVWRKEVAK